MQEIPFASRAAMPAAILLFVSAVITPLHAAEPGAQEPGIEYHILAAEIAGQRGEAELAAREYLKALRLQPTRDLAERATQVAVYAGNSSLAMEAATYWAELDPDRLEPRIVLMRVAVQLDQVAAAIEHGLHIADKHSKGPEQAMRDIAHALSSETANAQSALAVMSGLRAEYKDLPEAEYAAGLLALRLEALQEAVMSADNALSLREGWTDAILLKATALLRMERLEAAEQVIAATEIDDSEQITLLLAFARLLLEADYAEAAARQYQKALELDAQQPEALYAMGILQMSLGDMDAAYGHFRTLHDEVGLRQDISAYYLGTIEESRGNYEQALEWYEKVGEGDRQLDAAQRKAFVLYKLGDLEEARKWLAGMRAAEPEMAVQFYLAEGELLYEAKRFEDAMALYNEGLGEFPDDVDLLYGRSLIAERMGRLTLSERDLRRILELEPDDSRSLNALGYILANHTSRFDEALLLISRALEQNPDDAAVIDSMGWVQFRLGNLDTALDYLSRAYDSMPDPEVAAHLAEVLWELGRQEQAETILQDALQEEPDHQVLRDTIKRLMQ